MHLIKPLKTYVRVSCAMCRADLANNNNKEKEYK